AAASYPLRKVDVFMKGSLYLRNANSLRPVRRPNWCHDRYPTSSSRCLRLTWQAPHEKACRIRAMSPGKVWNVLLVMALAVGAAPAKGSADPPPASQDEEEAHQVSRLVRQLNDDAAARRDEAEQKLVELAGANTAVVDHFLSLLPPDSDQLPLAVRERLAAIRKQVEDRAAKAAVSSTTVTLKAEQL